MDFIYEPERIIVKNEENKIVGEIDFPLQADGNYVITHTFVDDSLSYRQLATANRVLLLSYFLHF